MAALVLLVATAAAARLGDLARREPGDVFTVIANECGPSQCAEHGAGASADGAPCECACPQRAPLFREDRELCVDDLPECSLATFGTGLGVQRIPFVYLPLKGQIIHPSKEITFQNVKTPICAVSGAQFLTRKGFLDLRNTLDADVPFNLFRDEGRTFLQWSGEDEVRARMSGRVMVVRLLCRDVDATPTSPLDLRGVFTPCVAFRVQGTPPRHNSNMTEVQFALNAQTTATTNNSGLTVTEYVAIGISSLLLGLIYVASVFLYLHIRKRRKTASEEGTRRPKSLKKKDGTVITERDIIRINNERMPSLPNNIGQDEGVVKKNPLLTMRQQFHDGKSSFTSDSASNMSDSEDFRDGSVQSDSNVQRQTTSAVVHPRGDSKLQHDVSETNHRDESNIERLPDEHVSIVETTDDREIARPVGTTRRKLYFNPAYFEPQLMAEPPPAALEFLVKIREVISIAKHKMAAKRFHPVLNQIPEEESYPSTRNSIDLYHGLGSQRSGSIVSLKRENSRKRSVNCVGCPGCKSDNGVDLQNFMKYDIPACANCVKNSGDKQNSIRQWLENIPNVKQQAFFNDFMPTSNQTGMVNSLLSLPVSNDRNKIKKQNSFSGVKHMHHSDNLSKPKTHSTMSVRSEPIATRHYNLPLPEFKNLESKQNNYDAYCQTVSKTDDISPIGLNDHRSGSLRNNVLTTQQRNKFIANKNALPDMVNEAIALEHCSKSFNFSSSDEEKYNKIKRNMNHMYSRKQAESPPVHDYETDSLERISHKKGISTPTEYPEVSSSQASPSLSNALPLEEELTMRNAVYKHSSSSSNTPSPHRDIFIDQNHYETIERQKNIDKTVENDTKAKNYSLVSEVYVNNNFGSPPSSPNGSENGSESSLGSRKLLPDVKNDAVPGCLTIEVKDSPENYIKIHESDDFEPDTLDRKHPKHRDIVESVQFSRKNLIRSITNNEHQPSQRILLRSSGTFTKTNDRIENATKFNSLRNDFELGKNNYDRPKLSPTTFSRTKSLDANVDDEWEDVGDWTTEDGRMLTLELRHSKRQRQCTPPTIKQMKSLARPDILPPLPPTDESPIYEQPAYPPRRVENSLLPIDRETKNSSGRSLSPRTSSKDTVECKRKKSVSRERHYGPSCSPMRASVDSLSSEYENLPSINAFREHQKTGEFCRNSRRPSIRSNCSNEINTMTFVREQRPENVSKRQKRRKGATIEDSGYLSSDSTSSRQVQRKLVVAKIVSCSDSDDTENEARSESGAESIETHSVYFGSFRKLQAAENNSFKTARDSRRKRNSDSNF